MTNSPDPEKQLGFIPPHGGYAGLKAYQMSVLVSYVENAPPEVSANTMLCLVHQTNYLLDQLLRQLEQAFLKEGGFTERLYQARQQARALPPRPSCGAGVLAGGFRRRPAARMQPQIRARRPANPPAGTPALLRS